MNYALYMASTGMLTSMYRQDVWSNNLANVDTVGFKPDIPRLRQRAAATVEDGLGNMPSNKMLERLGAGVHLSPNHLDLEQGSLDTTNDPFNLAIEGEGFFNVTTGSASGEERLRLTRDGRFARRADGKLVHTASGGTVLDSSDRPIVLGPEAFVVDRDGTIRQGGQAVATIGVTRVADAGVLEKVGNNLFRMPAEAIASRDRKGTGQVVQGALERSGVDPIQAIMRVNEASNAVASNARMVSLLDELMGRTINTFARVA